MSNMALLALLRRMKRDDITAHGFRSCFRDWASECTSVPSEVAEMALAHTIANRVEAAYRRGDLFEKPFHLNQFAFRAIERFGIFKSGLSPNLPDYSERSLPSKTT